MVPSWTERRRHGWAGPPRQRMGQSWNSISVLRHFERELQHILRFGVRKRHELLCKVTDLTRLVLREGRLRWTKLHQIAEPLPLSLEWKPKVTYGATAWVWSTFLCSNTTPVGHTRHTHITHSSRSAVGFLWQRSLSYCVKHQFISQCFEGCKWVTQMSYQRCLGLLPSFFSWTQPWSFPAVSCPDKAPSQSGIVPPPSPPFFPSIRSIGALSSQALLSFHLRETPPRLRPTQRSRQLKATHRASSILPSTSPFLSDLLRIIYNLFKSSRKSSVPTWLKSTPASNGSLPSLTSSSRWVGAFNMR